jgi:hypothetical protein
VCLKRKEVKENYFLLQIAICPTRKRSESSKIVVSFSFCYFARIYWNQTKLTNEKSKERKWCWSHDIAIHGAAEDGHRPSAMIPWIEWRENCFQVQNNLALNLGFTLCGLCKLELFLISLRLGYHIYKMAQILKLECQKLQPSPIKTTSNVIFNLKRLKKFWWHWAVFWRRSNEFSRFLSPRGWVCGRMLFEWIYIFKQLR